MAESNLPEKIGRREALARIGSYVAGIAAMPLVARSAWASGQGSDPRPNLVLIIADDLGYGDVGCFGCPDIATPNLNALAAQGVRFSSFYVAAPVCSPTRVSAMTGKYSQRTTLPNLPDSHDPNAGLSPDEVTLAELLKSAGYATGLVGKWGTQWNGSFNPPLPPPICPFVGLAHLQPPVPTTRHQVNVCLRDQPQHPTQPRQHGYHTSHSPRFPTPISCPSLNSLTPFSASIKAVTVSS